MAMDYFTENSFTLKQKCKYCFNEYDYCERDFKYRYDTVNNENLRVICKFSKCGKEIYPSWNEIPTVVKERFLGIDHFMRWSKNCEECKKDGKGIFISGKEYVSTMSIVDVKPGGWRDCWSKGGKQIKQHCYTCGKNIPKTGYHPKVILDEVYRLHEAKEC
jgi:hypothetical protein